MLKKIFLGGLVFFCIYGALNYSGFCFKKMRYLSDDEKIRLAVAVVNKIGGGHYSKPGVGNIKYRTVIRYKNVDTFLRENPACCSVVPYYGFQHVTDDPDPPAFWQRALGRYDYAVRIRYTFRYIEGTLDNNNTKGPGKRYEESKFGDYRFNNCGELVWYD